MLLLAARAASLARPARVLGRRVALRSGDGEAAWPEATLAKIAAGAGTPAALAALKAELAVAGDAPDAAYGACFPSRSTPSSATRLDSARAAGLSTGDSGVRRDAAVVVMTTEVFRNMIYDDEGRAEIAKDVFAVVFDEFHYMNDAQRGTVWEESVVGCPATARIVALSATVSNARSVAGWMASIHGPTDVVETDFRPVPLRYEFAEDGAVVPLFRARTSGGTRARARKRLQLNPALDKPREKPKRVGRDKFDRRGGKFDEGAMPSREILKNLQKRDRLPAIFFVFSRKGCENEAANCGSLQLLNVDEETLARKRIRAWALENEDVARLDSERERVDLLTRGVAAHHAGLLPQYKTLVEELFRDGLVKACFATETLAAGVNLPARTTVVTSLVKRGDDGMEPLTTSALLQMAGRAGRRGRTPRARSSPRGRKFGDRDAGLARRVLLSDVLPIASSSRRPTASRARCSAAATSSAAGLSSNGASGAIWRTAGPEKVGRRRRSRSAGLAEHVLRDYTVLLSAAGDACDAFEAAQGLDDDREIEDARRALRAQGAVLASPVSRLAPDKQLEALEAYDALKAANEAPRPPVAALFSAFVCEIGDRRGVFVDYGPSAKVRDATDALFERAVLP
ncbi:hypothetical protein JL720_973 [Aureococcus anophagefferens]|nr:hypothetical protein JL720_973 [Aureococcus anophagefferens]